MKTPEQVLENPLSGWEIDIPGIVMTLLDGQYEVRIEPLLFGGAYLAVYRHSAVTDELDLIGEKMPITLGTPAQRGFVS